MTTEQKYILFTLLEYAEKDYENYLKNHGELDPFTMERHGIVIAYRNIIDVLHLSNAEIKRVYAAYQEHTSSAK